MSCIGPGPYHQAKQAAIDLFQRNYIRTMIDLHRGNLTAAAWEAGLERATFRGLMKKHGIRRKHNPPRCPRKYRVNT